MSVSSFTFTSASRHLKIRLRGGHHPPGRIGGPSWFNLPFLEEGQLLAKEEILRSQGTAGMRREENQSDEVEHDQGQRRKQCATARKTDERDMNAQDCTLQNATGARFRRGRSFCGAQVAFDPPAVAQMQTVVLMFRHFSPSWLCENAQMIIGVMAWPVKRGTKREVKQSSRGEVWPHERGQLRCSPETGM
jgi:hypothetical protein